ncbi:MAG: InlB B-repeat-containing protein [Clostridiales Family XIII bacterium]|jgi:hypothetical protein|nr:InlB B-repeat-containing protein [Clostridiales Family XIII bacterium]
MKTTFGRKLLALLLTLAMLFSLAPGAFAAGIEPEPSAKKGTSTEGPLAGPGQILEALGKTATEPGQGNTVQGNETYIFGDKEYKVIHNDYIACYVSMDDGGFTVLPAAAEFDPDKPESHGTFIIDGEAFVFGDVKGDLAAGDGTIFIPPVVEKDMVAAHYAVGDYVISQYLAITEDTGHENAYAVKVGYGAEYFGIKESGISGEILIDTLLGKKDDLPLLTDDGVFLTTEAELSPVPGSLYVSEDKDGAKAFLVLKEEKGSAPASLTFGDIGRLSADAIQTGSAVTDSAVKLHFSEIWSDDTAVTEKAASTTGTDDTAKGSSIAIFNTNYGFYDLTKADIEFEPSIKEKEDADSAAETDIAEAAPKYAKRSGVAKSGMAAMAASPGAHPFYIDVEGPSSVTMVTEMMLTENNGHREGRVNVGDKISFTAKLVNDKRITSTLKVGYIVPLSGGSREEKEISVTPDNNGIYTFTVPSDILVDAQNPEENGYVGISIYVRPDTNAMRLYPSNENPGKVKEYVTVTTPAGEVLEHALYALVGDKVTVTLERLDADYAPTLNARVTYSGGDLADLPITPKSSGTDTYTFTVPGNNADKVSAIYLTISAKAYDSGTYVINKRIVAASPAGLSLDVKVSSGAVDAFAPIMPNAGLLHAEAGDTVKASVSAIGTDNSWLGAPTATLSAINLSTGAIIKSQDLKNLANDFEFTMPNANVELTLNLTAKPRVTTRVAYPQGEMIQGSGATLTASPISDSGEVTLNINLFGNGYQLNGKNEHTDGSVNSYLKVYKYNGSTLEEINFPSLAPIAYQQSYTYTTTEDIVAELVLEKTPSSPAMHTISTMPFVGEGETVYDISYWISKGTDHSVNSANDTFKKGALDEAGKTMKAATGSDIMFYASPKQLNSEWNVKRVYVIVGEGDDAIEYVYGYDNSNPFIEKIGDAYTFTMPDAPVTIGVEAQKAQGQIVTETFVEIDGKEQPYDARQDGVGNLQAYKLKAGGTGTPNFSAAGNMEKAGTAGIGDMVYIAAYPMWGGRLRSITVDQEGYATTPLMANGYDQNLSADLYSFQAVRGMTYKVKAVYTTDDIAKVKINGSEDDRILTVIGGRERSMMFSRIYNQTSGKRYTASAIIELKTSDLLSRDMFYTLEVGDNSSYYRPGDIDLKLIESQSGYSRYELTVSPAADIPQGGRPDINIKVVAADHRARPVIETMAPNHTNRSKFDHIIITGKNLQKFKDRTYTPEATLFKTENADQLLTEGIGYAVDLTKLEVNAAGSEAKLYVKRPGVITSPKNAGDPMPEFKAGEYYYLNAGWYWGIAPLTEYDEKWTEWPISDMPINFKSNAGFCYAGIGKVKGPNHYWITVGETLEDVKGDDRFEDMLVTFECKDGFKFRNEGGKIVIYINNGTNPVLVNGTLTLERILERVDYVPFITQTGNSVLVEAPMKLVAKGTTLFSPIGSMGKMNMELNQGTKYSSKAGSANPPTFVPQGVITMDVFGMNGFTAEYTSIKMYPTTVQLAGGLQLQVPGLNMPIAGMNIKNLQFNLNGSSAGFDGIEADGKVDAGFGIIAINGYANVNTFKKYYSFGGALETPVFEANGHLELIESKRFHIPMLEEFHIQASASKGIPLVPPVTVGYIIGLEGGLSGLSSTLDYDPTDSAKPLIPPLKFSAGAKFQLLELFEFWVELTVGPVYYKQSIHDAYVNIGPINLQLFEEFSTEVGATDFWRGNKNKVAYEFNSRLRVNLLKGIVSDVFIATGDLKVGASIDHPAYWISDKDTYANVLALLNAINAEFYAAGSLRGLLQIPQVTFLGVDYGPYKVASVGAWFDMNIPLSERIKASSFRAGAELGFGPLDVAVEYDFIQPWNPPNFDISLFSAGTDGKTVADYALYSETFGDKKTGGKIVIGEGIRVAADSFGEVKEQPVPKNTGALRTMATQSAAADPSEDADISVYGDVGGSIHTINVPDNDDESYWIQAASLVAGAEDMNLTLYGPSGAPVAIRPVPMGVESTAEQAEASYNALRAGDGSGLMVRVDGPGEYKLTSNGEFRSWVMEADAKPEITESKLTENNAKLSFTAENLESAKNYRYKVILEKKDAYNEESEDSVLLDEGDVTGYATTFSNTLTLSDYGLNDKLESGKYIPTVLLYEVTTADDRELISTGRIYTPIDVANTKASIIAPGALNDLAVTAAGNESINLKFTGATAAAGFGQVKDDDNFSTNESANQAKWSPAYYMVNLYDETGKLATRAVDDNSGQMETPLSFTITENQKKADGKFDVLLSGIPGGHTYSMKVTPIFTSEYQMNMKNVLPSGAVSKALVSVDEGYQNDRLELQQQGVPVTRNIAVPIADPPQLTIEPFRGAKDTVNGTTTYYLLEGSYLDINVDQPADITVRKYSAAARDPALKAAVNAKTLQLKETDFIDKAGEIMTNGLFAITAKNAAGDTMTELVNIVIDKVAPFLLVDDLNSSQRKTSDGNYAITGSTEPGAEVMSSAGHRVTSGADGRFTLNGAISGDREDVFISTSDLAGNTVTESVTIIRSLESDVPNEGGKKDATKKPPKVAVKTVNVKFSANGGTLIVKKKGKRVKVKSITKKLTIGKKFGSLPAASRKGMYKFKGWYTTKKKGGKRITKNTVVKYKKTTTLYARWFVRYGKLKKGVSALNIRSLSMARSAIKGYVRKSVKFRITKKINRKGNANDWYKITYKKKSGKKVTGYVNARYVKAYWTNPAA